MPPYRQMPAMLAIALLILPWVNPFAGGPSAAVVPWLVSAACAVVLWGHLLPRLGRAGASKSAWGSVAAAGWLAAALISSVIALIQYFGLADHFTPLLGAPGPGEAYANLRQRNQFASLTAIGMASLIWMSGPVKGRYAVPAMVLLAGANAASASRTGLLQMMMLMMFVAAWKGPEGRRRQRLCLMGAGAYLTAALMLPSLLQALTGASAPSVWGRLTGDLGCSSRKVLWSNVLHLMAQRPWLGWGWGEMDYAHYITLYEGPRFCAILDNAHNLPLHLAAELGVPAALLLCGLAFWAIARAEPWRETDPLRQLAWAVLAVIGVHSLLEYPLWYGPFQIAAALCVALLWPAQNGVANSRPPLLRYTVAVLALVAIAYAAWDYRRISQIYLPPEARATAYRDDILGKLRGSWLFRDHVLFAELTTTPLTRGNAQWTFDSANTLLHYSPEPRVIEKLIESAMQTGREEEAAVHLRRFRAAFPEEHRLWAARIGLPSPPAPRPLRD